MPGCILCYTIPYYTISYCIIRYCMINNNMLMCYIIPYDMVSMLYVGSEILFTFGPEPGQNSQQRVFLKGPGFRA